MASGWGLRNRTPETAPHCRFLAKRLTNSNDTTFVCWCFCEFQILSKYPNITNNLKTHQNIITNFGRIVWFWKWHLFLSKTKNISNLTLFVKITYQMQGRRQLSKIGGAKLKWGGQSWKPALNLTQFFIIPELDLGEFSVKIKWSPKKKGLRRNPKAFSGRNQKFKR